MAKEFRSVEHVVLPVSRKRARSMFRIAGACRYVWNHFRNKNLADYQKFEKGEGERPKTSFFSLGKEFIRLRKEKETEWLQELPCSPVRYALKYFSDALTQAMAGEKGFPKPKSRSRTVPSFTLPDANSFTIKKINGKYSRLLIPRVGWVTLVRKGGNPYEDAEAKQVVLRHDGFRWRAFVLYEVEVEKKPDDGEVLGVDMNVGQVSTSDGQFHSMPDIEKKERRRKRYQRRMAKQQKGSKRRNRTKKRIAKISRKIRNIRRNWTHETTRTIADKCGTVATEDLNVREMTASARGTAENPGKNVKRKAALNRGILDTGFAEFRQKLEYKCGRLIAVKPEYTSQTCSRCGHASKENRKTQARFLCVSCGFESNADTNAATNIRRLGMAQLHGEDTPSGGPVNREIDTGLP